MIWYMFCPVFVSLCKVTLIWTVLLGNQGCLHFTHGTSQVSIYRTNTKLSLSLRILCLVFSYFFSVATSNKSTGQRLSENLASLPLYHCVLLCFQTGSSHVTQCAHICAIVTQINTRTEDPRGTKRPFSLHLPCSRDKTVFLVSKWFYIRRVLLYCIVYLSTSSLCNFSKVPNYCYFVLCINFVL